MSYHFKNVDQEKVSALFSPPMVKYERKKRVVYLPLATLKKSTRAQVMQRAYDYKRQQARQQAERSLMEEDQRSYQLFRETKMRLIEGNETVIRDVDALLHTQAQEKQLAKEKTFIDYEMNAFIPIHAQIQEDVEKKCSKYYMQYKRKQAENYVAVSRQPGQNIDNIDPTKYDPFVLKTEPSRVYFDDPMYRAARVKKQENDIISNIDKLISEQTAHYAFEGHSLEELRKGELHAKRQSRQRDIVDVKKWAAIDQVIAIPGVVHARQCVNPVYKTCPIYIPDDQ